MTANTTCSPATCPKPSTMGEFACKNKGQCWEPCGSLGNDAKFARPASEAQTLALEKALRSPSFQSASEGC